ncbi:MAG TPA: CBS domain-containing protein [Nitrososphaerales archaeon]|nr:CBS domain-containing protein [Nitrososphaerales archaeon]
MDRVINIMSKAVIHTIRPDATIGEAARRMKEVNKGCLIVVDQRRPMGIITERDLVQKVLAAGRFPERVPVSEVMSTPVITVDPEAPVSDAALLMVKNKIRRLVVTEGGKVVGVLTVTDFAKYLQPKAGRDPMLDAMARGVLLLTQAETA